MTVEKPSTSSRRSTTSPTDPRELIADLGLGDKRDTAYRNLSGGQKQRLSIALALIGRPRIAILDELSTGLDPQARRETWHLIESIRGRGVTVVLVTHLMEEAERLADRVAVIAEGRLIALDTPAGIVSMVDAEQRLRFRPSAPIEDTLLMDLPEVRRVERAGPSIVVTGTGNLIEAVTSVLALTRSSRTTCGSSRRTSTTPTSPSRAASRGPHRQGAVMNEMRALLVSREPLLFRDPDHVAGGDRPADGDPADLRLDVRPQAAGPGVRRPALHRRVRAIADRDHDRHARHPDAADPPRDLSREGHPAAPFDDAAHPLRLLAAQLVIYMVIAVIALVLLVVVAHVAFGVPWPGNPSAISRRSSSGMGAMFAIGALLAAVAPSNRAATALAIPMFFAVMFLGGVYLPRVFLPDILVRIGEFTPPGVQGLQDAWFGTAPQLAPLLGMARRHASSSGPLAVRLFRWE